MPAKPIPDGYHSVTQYLIVQNAAAAIEFYRRALGAKEELRLTAPDGKIGHAEIRVGDSVIMLADEHPGMGYRAPHEPGAAGVSLMVYVEDVDRVYAQAVAAGAKSRRPVVDQFYGDRSGTLDDPYGHVWTIATHKEDLSPEDIDRRAAELLRKKD